MSALRTRPVGARALLVDVPDHATALALALWAREHVEAEDVVPAAATVLLDGCVPDEAARAVERWEPTSQSPAGELVRVPVTWDGPDLAPLAASLGLTAGRLVESLVEVEHVVAFCGFAPGFAYLTGSAYDVPRLATPRSRVEPGSVGMAGPFLGIYPTASPGGWQLVGRTDVTLWDPARPEPALLPPGTRVRLA